MKAQTDPRQIYTIAAKWDDVWTLPSTKNPLKTWHFHKQWHVEVCWLCYECYCHYYKFTSYLHLYLEIKAISNKISWPQNSASSTDTSENADKQVPSYSKRDNIILLLFIFTVWKSFLNIDSPYVLLPSESAT